MKARSFVDSTLLHATAGKGGDGSKSFRHEKFVPRGGPDGGDGGRGGHVWLVGDEDVDSLVGVFYEPERRAQDGGAGRGRYRHGANGADVFVKVPLGTVVSDADTGRVLGEVLKHGQKLLVARGGDGGAGNVHYKSSTHQAPEEFKPGKPGEDVRLRLDLKVLADVGLVGFPSAGKSSILRRISKARPKVAAYHFTTLHPILGTVEVPDSFARFRVADIPGIIEGAHEGAGLGDSFLRHIERARVLVLVVDVGAEEGRNPVDDYATLLRELEARDPALLERPRLVVASKADLPGSEERLRELRAAVGSSPIVTSVPLDRGFDKLVARLVRMVKPSEAPEGRAPVAPESGHAGGDAAPATLRSVFGGAAVKPHRRAAASGAARAAKTGRESAPGRTPPRPVEGRGEHPMSPADVSAERLATLGTFLKR